MSAFQYKWTKNEQGTDTFSLCFEKCTHEPLSWKEEMHAAARLIAKRASRPLMLCFSGGIDSESMCRAFYEQGISFTVLTLEYAGGKNNHDTFYAKKWCQEHRVHQELRTIDFEEIVNRDAERYMREGYVAGWPFRFIQLRILEIAEEMGMFAVLGGGEQLYHANDSGVYVRFDPGFAASLAWCAKHGVDHEPYFFFSTPELCAAYQQIPIVDFALRDPGYFTHPSNAYLFKMFVYQSQFPDLLGRYKYTGFENLKDQHRLLYERMQKQFGARLIPYELPVTRFKEQLGVATKQVVG